MAKFIYGNDLNSEIGRIFSTANKYLLIISPYIKLHEHYASILLEKRNIPELRVVLVFGKNEEDKSKSLSSVDLEFFKSFSNIEILESRAVRSPCAAAYFLDNKEISLRSAWISSN